MEISRNQLRQLGKRLRHATTVEAKDLESLQAYRVSHRGAIGAVFSDLGTSSSGLGEGVTISLRIKRLDSIIGKLSRLSDRPLENMGDIAGCRCITRTDAQLRELEKKILDRYDVKEKNINDYRGVNRQSTGYSALHIYVRHTAYPERQVEIQLRTLEQHKWATLVEMSDVVFNSGLKEYRRDEQLGRLHLLLAKSDGQLSSEELVEICKILKDYNYTERLSEIFSENVRQVRQEWALSVSSKKQEFYLLEVNSSGQSKIRGFSEFEEAENEYFKRYNEQSDVNLVITRIKSVNFDKLSLAYTNYVMTYHSYFERFLAIYQQALSKSVKNSEIMLSISLSRQYWKLHLQNVNARLNEVEMSTNILQNVPSERDGRKRTAEWRGDMINAAGDFRSRTLRHLRALDRDFGRSVLGRILQKYFNYEKNRAFKSVEQRLKQIESTS